MGLQKQPPNDVMAPVVVPAWPGTYGIVTHPEPGLVPVIAFTLGWVSRGGGNSNAPPTPDEGKVVDLFAAKQKREKKPAKKGGSCPGYARPASEGMGVVGAITQGQPGAVYEAFWYSGAGIVAYGGRMMDMGEFLQEKGLPADTFTVE